MTEPIRVLSSFKAPRPTTNPYITMLDGALRAAPGVRMRRFSWLTALFGRYDVFHWHWPESRMHGSSWWKSAGLITLTAALALRHTASRRIAVVQTVHNVELPNVDPVQRWILRRIAATVDEAITLNDTTVPPRDVPYALIPHGHYRDWFAAYPHAERVAGRLGTFGQVRRYKGLDALIGAFAEASAVDPEISLCIGGKPTSTELEADLTASTAAIPRLTLDLRFLPDADLVTLATESELVVLAYRFMHNSGSALAALSLNRPVLVPRNEVNEHLADEVGAGWVHLYDGDLDAATLRDALAAASGLAPDARPDLSARDWDDAGAAHERAYRDAVARVRGTRA